MFSESWKTRIGIERLKEYFGDDIDPNLSEAVILQFVSKKLSMLQHKEDGGADEFYVERGPVSLFGANEISNGRLICIK
jgi:hypothetical protein